MLIDVFVFLFLVSRVISFCFFVCFRESLVGLFFFDLVFCGGKGGGLLFLWLCLWIRGGLLDRKLYVGWWFFCEERSIFFFEGLNVWV